MPRSTRSMPALPADAAQADATAPDPTSPADLPNRRPDRVSATFVDPSTPIESLPCYTPGALGAAVVLDLSRVFLAMGNSCAIGFVRWR